MTRESLASEVTGSVLSDVIAGRYAPGDRLPSEHEFARRYDVSRVTVREAMKTLAARGIVTIRSGSGLTVNPVADWTSLGHVVSYAARHESQREVVRRLLEVRRLIETGAAGLAAVHADAGQHEAMHECLEEMTVAHAQDDVESFVAADLRFHDGVLASADNPFLEMLYRPIRAVLAEHRVQSSIAPQFRSDNISAHRAVLAAIVAGDEDGAAAAMAAHIDQTREDFDEYVFDGATSEPEDRRATR